MTLNIKYRQIKAFLLAAQCGSFTHAASKLGVTQPSLTTLIQELEQTLGLKLFERTTRSLNLTSAGEDFHARILRPVADMEEAYRSAADLSAARRGHVVLGALPSCALSLVPATLDHLRQRHPAITVRLVEAHNDALLEMVRTNQVEFAIATAIRAEASPEFSHQPLVDDVFCAVFPEHHPLARVARPGWGDMKGYDLILLSRGSSTRALFERTLPDVHDTAPRYDVTHMGTAAGLVRKGLGVTVLPRIALAELNLNGLRSAAIADRSAHRTISFVHRSDRLLSPAAQALVRSLRHVTDELALRLRSDTIYS